TLSMYNFALGDVLRDEIRGVQAKRRLGEVVRERLPLVGTLQLSRDLLLPGDVLCLDSLLLGVPLLVQRVPFVVLPLVLLGACARPLKLVVVLAVVQRDLLQGVRDPVEGGEQLLDHQASPPASDRARKLSSFARSSWSPPTLARSAKVGG